MIVPGEDIIRVAESVGDALIESCARIDGEPVPVPSDAFFDTLRGGDVSVAPPEVHETIRLSGAPWYLSGLAFFGRAMHPVVELARLLDLVATSSDSVTLVWTSGDRVLLMIADALLAPLAAGIPMHRLDSDFPNRFLSAEVTVHEFALGGSVYAIPAGELPELDTSHTVMLAAAGGSLVCGAIRVDDRVVPVLDLHAYLGFRIDDASTGAGLLVHNGDFEAAFYPHRSLGQRTPELSVQRPLPLAHARPLVYGCYVGGSDVRLILNVAMIAQSPQDPATQAALAAPADPTARFVPGGGAPSPSPAPAPAAAFSRESRPRAPVRRDAARPSRRPLTFILLLALLATIVVAGIMFVPGVIDRAVSGGGAGERPGGGDPPTSWRSPATPPATGETGPEETRPPRRVSLRVSFGALWQRCLITGALRRTGARHVRVSGAAVRCRA